MDEYGQTALEWAVDNKKSRLALRLYKKGAQVKSSDKEWLLRHLIQLGNVSLLRRFCEDHTEVIYQKSPVKLLVLESIKNHPEKRQDKILEVLYSHGLKKAVSWMEAKVFIASILSSALLATMPYICQPDYDI